MQQLRLEQRPPAQDNWNRAIVFLHWLTLLVLVMVFVLGFARDWADDRSLAKAMLSWHRLAGLVVFAIVLPRLVLRGTSQRPAYGLPRLSRIAAGCVHSALYALMLSMPVLGYLCTCARAGRVEVAGFHVVALIGKDRALAELLEDLHRATGFLMLLLVGLHAGAALWHHWVVRDGTLVRMLPRRAPLSVPRSTPSEG